jgi:hypothetical protein
VVRHLDPLGRRAETRLPMSSVSPVAARVQPSRRERRGGGRAVWAVRGVWADGRVLRGVLVAPSPLFVVCETASGGGTPRGESSLESVARGTGFGPSSAGGLSASSSARNGHALGGRKRGGDGALAVRLHRGAGAQPGEPSPCVVRFFPHARHRRAAMRVLPSPSLGPNPAERAACPPSPA